MLHLPPRHRPTRLYQPSRHTTVRMAVADGPLSSAVRPPLLASRADEQLFVAPPNQAGMALHGTVCKAALVPAVT